MKSLLQKRNPIARRRTGAFVTNIVWWVNRLASAVTLFVMATISSASFRGKAKGLEPGIHFTT
jgi:hypothetical protein